MGTLWQDVRYGLRMLARSPGFVVVVLLVLGLGIGANAALFNALDQVYLRLLPVTKPRELVSVQFRYRHGAWETVGSGFSHPTYEAYHDRSQVFADLAAFTGTSGMGLRSLVGLHHADPGYDTRQILVVRFDLDGWLLDRPDLCRFMEDLRERVSRWPAVASAGLAVCPPVSETSGGRTVIDIEGAEVPVEGEVQWRLNTVGPGYFQTLGQALLAGRVFTVQDGPDAPKVIVVNEVMARHYWPNQDPLGKRVRFRVGEGEEPDVREVVGVVRCVKLRSILDEPAPIAYLSLDQQTNKKWKATPVLLVRTEGSPHVLIPALRREAVALGVPAALDIRTVAERISALLMTQQLLAAILNLFGLVGLLLSAAGLYAVMAYAVRQRTREIGIRIALGARGRDVVTPVLLRGTLLLMAGLGLGTGLSLAGTRLLVSRLGQIRAWDKYFLQGIYTWDPVTYAGTILLIVAVTLTACYLPARRAARVDPMVALRCE